MFDLYVYACFVGLGIMVWFTANGLSLVMRVRAGSYSHAHVDILVLDHLILTLKIKHPLNSYVSRISYVITGMNNSLAMPLLSF